VRADVADEALQDSPAAIDRAIAQPHNVIRRHNHAAVRPDRQ
jgi:hypothetical protein